MFFWVRYAFLKVPPLQLPNERQFRGGPLRRNQAHLHITTHFPTPLQSERRYDFVDQWTCAGRRCLLISEAGRFLTKKSLICQFAMWPPAGRSCRTTTPSSSMSGSIWTPTTRLYLLWKYQRRQTQSLSFMISSGGTHSKNMTSFPGLQHLQLTRFSVASRCYC